MRAALVAEALEVARCGPTALSLREVTRRVGVSPAAAYRHFRDRSALMGALASEIQDRMVARMRARDESLTEQDPQNAALLRLRGVGLGYIDFALEEPGWFELAFFGPADEDGLPSSVRVPPASGARLGPAAVSGSRPGAAAANASRPGSSPGRGTDPAGSPALRQVPPFAELMAALDECAATGALSPERRRGAEFSCWSAVHGCAELMVHGPLRGAPGPVVREVAERVVDDIVAGVR
nr:TetR/AcrR family transcriptional regulator [Brachybacterium sacelli]